MITVILRWTCSVKNVPELFLDCPGAAHFKARVPGIAAPAAQDPGRRRMAGAEALTWRACFGLLNMEVRERRIWTRDRDRECEGRPLPDEKDDKLWEVVIL